MTPFLRCLFVLTALYLSQSTTVFASSIDGKRVTFTRLLEELTNDVVDVPSAKNVGYMVSYQAKKDFIVLRDVEIVFDRGIDNPLDERFVNGGKPIVIKKGVEFHRCKFPPVFWYLLRNVVFEDIVGFRQCTSLYAKFKEVTFKRHFYIYESQIEFFEFDNCTFGHGFEMGENAKIADHLSFTNCTFTMIPELIKNPQVHEERNVIKNLKAVPPFFQILNRVDPFDLNFDHCTFTLDSAIQNRERFAINLNSSQFNSFHLINSFADVPINFSNSFITNQFSVHHCKFKGKVLAEALNFSTGNAKLEWASFANSKIAVYDTEQKLFLHGDSLSLVKDDFYFNTLISTYALFYTTYRQQGNRLSANACYREWKDVETAYLAYMKDNNSDFQLYFNWLMNVFLKVFCDYGTNPIKSMVWSFYVMIGFGLFYFFFPKQSGIQKNLSLRLKIKNLSRWFTERESLQKIFQDATTNKEPTSDEVTELSEFITTHKKSLPLYYWFLGGRWFNLSLIYYKVEHALLVGFSKLIDSWRKKNTFFRSLASISFLLMLISMALVDIFMRLLDSLTTSLNAFSTLGFGDIPVRGVAKYLAVLEGFIGWFLLSIFSVSLISQIIQ
jgi:hypothetical protein